MKNRPSTPDPSEDPRVTLNPATIALDLRSVPVILDDDRLNPECDLVELSETAERARAVDLGAAAQQAVLADGQEEEFAHRSRSRALEAHLMATDPLWTSLEDEYRARKEDERRLAEVPDSTLTAKRKKISLAAKPAFLLGDTCVIAALMWRSGTNMFLSVGTGLAASLAMVSIGSMYGRTKTERDQRLGRGARPDGCPADVVHLYAPDVNDAEARSDAVWTAISLVVAVGFLLALTAFGWASGEPIGIALFAGILGALSLPGSAALEAYGTNSAADLRDEARKQVEAIATELRALAELAYEHRREAELAVGAHRATGHRAVATGITTAVVADRTPDHPRIFGYLCQSPKVSHGLANGPEPELHADSIARPVFDRRRPASTGPDQVAQAPVEQLPVRREVA